MHVEPPALRMRCAVPWRLRHAVTLGMRARLAWHASACILFDGEVRLLSELAMCGLLGVVGLHKTQNDVRLFVEGTSSRMLKFYRPDSAKSEKVDLKIPFECMALARQRHDVG